MAEIPVSSANSEFLKEEEAHIFNITAQHHQIFLKYIRIHPTISNDLSKFPKTLEIMTNELNSLGESQTREDWIEILGAWKKNVKILANTGNIKLTDEDNELMNLLSLSCQNLTTIQLSTILDHLEIVGDNPNIWITISVEMQALGAGRKTEEYWKNLFENWTQKTKKKYRDNITLSESEQRFIKYCSSSMKEIVLEEASSTKILEVLANHCRVCLALTQESAYLFTDSEDNLTLADKINMFCDIQAIEKEDEYPKYVCKSCETMIESAYQFKNLCEKSDNELRNLVNEFVKNETVELYEEEEGLKEGCEEVEMETEEIEYTIDEIHDDGIEITFSNMSDPENEEEIQTFILAEPEEEEKSAEKPIKIFKPRDEEKKFPTCENCGVVFQLPSQLSKHLEKCNREGRKFSCDVCGKSYKKAMTLKIHKRVHTDERPYICETCGKSFRTYSAISNHMHTHSTFKMFKCIICDYAASTKSSLKIHGRTHTREQPYDCQICHMKFSTASNKHKHVRNIHEKLKTNKCQQCDRSFFSRDSVRKHMVIHTGIKPYICPACSVPYSWYNGLQKHMKTQHPGIKVPTEKSFVDPFHIDD